MTDNKLWILNVYPNVKRELSQIPKDLWYIFWCNTPQEWYRYDCNIQRWQKNRYNRRTVWGLVKQYNLPLHCRRMQLRYVVFKIRLQRIIKERKEWNQNEES